MDPIALLPQRRKIINCKTCNKEFYSDKSCKSRKPEFCSRRCANIFNACKPLTQKQKDALARGRKIPHSNKGSHWPIQSRLRFSLLKLGKKFPQYHCLALSVAKKGKPIQHFILNRGEINKKISHTLSGKPQPWNRGEHHHNWRGGITSINAQIRNSPEYARWRAEVFKRDNYTCQECGSRGKDLVADHIKPFALFPELRFELSNGRTLCKECDLQSDTYGGRALKYVTA